MFSQAIKFAVEYEFVYDQVSTQLFPILALSLISRTPFYITLIEQRTKRVSGDCVNSFIRVCLRISICAPRLPSSPFFSP